ncbi:acyl-CoA dehydrogenase family protein [Ruegeria atlantica]|uniref:Acyl-CoA dehydrogenase n=1 Tax=Ruegeria atlantica TaxID=81569 RepID=A0A0P1EH42_9RHOB|nr:Acyl-CoA dehydrogenase [Ruegeria atlantica]
MRHTNRDTRCARLDFAKASPEVSDGNLRAVWKAAGECGAFEFVLPPGLGSSINSASEFVEEMLLFGEFCADSGLAVAIVSQIWTIQRPLIRFASQELQDSYLSGLLSGELIGAFALTEPTAGSDALSLQTTAEHNRAGYILNGQKAFVGMGPVCDFAIAFAQTAPEKGRWGLSAFVVRADDEGFLRADRQEKVGLNSAPMGQLEFRDCWVPEARRIGREGAGATILQATLDWERCFILTAQVGAMRRQLNECTEHAVSRKQFGRSISEFQSVSNRLADMRVRLETCELMLARAAQLYDTGQPLTQFAAMTNLHISEAFLSSSMDAMRTFGGRGYLQSSNSGTDVNDALGGVIYSGTSDIQREIISKMELGKSSQPKNGGD